ncbi:NUDIX hydrolase [Rhizosaccharibacter radicis]|uniref:NUDIX domain-containing protein n=1 Tax=Rhizosaccharibacter radicis TaxID=2782605 RepID=A0ABT1W1Z9_9PROT|nr:NUDIX domain-containing protein [Acetobacteraceae bacterium KSS12]
MSRFARIQPEGEDRERVSCLDCGHVFYENPKIIVGAVVVQDERVLLCRRAIEPRRGYWTLPAGYLELNETAAEGAARETWEEAGARIDVEGILAIFDIARIGQVQIIHRARFADPGAPDARPGPESLEVGLFGWHGIPWDELAFPSVRWALDAWHQLGDAPLGAPFRNPPDDPRGEGVLPAEHAAAFTAAVRLPDPTRTLPS